MLLRFTKMHGLGNDFAMVDLISQKIRLDEAQIQALADRRTGIGFDQLLAVEVPDDPEADFRYRIYNADGTEAEQCGNGARCFTRFVRDRGLTPKTRITLQTNTGTIHCTLRKDGQISVNMGKPAFEPAQIPMCADAFRPVYELNLAGCQRPVSFTAVNMGNPHAVILVDDVDSAPVQELGPVIEHHPMFPERVNVGFMQVLSRNEIRLRVFERGVGETRACGSGACAAVAAGQLRELLDEAVTVHLTGGDLTIRHQLNIDDIVMTGPAARVYEGRLQI